MSLIVSGPQLSAWKTVTEGNASHIAAKVAGTYNLTVSQTVASATTISVTSIYYAGGGGGCKGTAGGTAGAGGIGGGGAGSLPNSAGGAAVANTGGGGGGAGIVSGGALAGGAGGSGIVILSIPTINYTGQSSGTVAVTTSGANTILTFTGAGTYIA
jgi:hypothetical protein